MSVRLWLARRMAPGGWHVQRDPVRRKRYTETWSVPDGVPALTDVLSDKPLPWWAERGTGMPVQFQRDLDAVFDPSLGNGAP